MTDLEKIVLGCIVQIGGSSEEEIAYQTQLAPAAVRLACIALYEQGKIATRTWLDADAAARVAESCKPGSLDAESGVVAVSSPVPVEGEPTVTPHRAGRRASPKTRQHRRGKLVA